MIEPQSSAPSVDTVLNPVHIGHHIIANFSVNETYKLEDSRNFKSFIDLLIDEFRLSKTGEVFHDFENGGFTGIISLNESHLSIRTWPDRNLLTLDVFLSNYLGDHSPTTETLYRSVKTFFNANVTFEHRFDH